MTRDDGHTAVSVFGGSIVVRLRAVPLGQEIEISKEELERLLDKAQRAARGGVLETGKAKKDGSKHSHADDLQQILSSGTGVFFGRKVKLI